ncbi:MAG: AraC family transcriptional regulator [Planctomycetes bacterium]|nr:AraC family transcriptional regulator [Planctomycetota bacterium]
MTEKTPRPASPDYVERVNLAIDHIVGHLDQPLKLADVAAVACFSAFHFHRVFQSLVGETLAQFVKRLRLERALYMLSHDTSRSLTRIALACGFASSSDFSRSFKQRYGVPPSAFDLETFRTQKRMEFQDALTDPDCRHLLERLPPGQNPDGFEVRFREIPARTVAYIRVLNPFAGTGVADYEGTSVADAARRLETWAEARGQADGQWLGYMWDDPEIVSLEDCRYDVAVEVDHVEPAGEVGRFDFSAMTVAEIEIRGAIDLEQRAIDWIFGTWLPSSGYVPAEHPSFESWIGRPFAHGYEHFELFVQLPVERS